MAENYHFCPPLLFFLSRRLSQELLGRNAGGGGGTLLSASLAGSFVTGEGKGDIGPTKKRAEKEDREEEDSSCSCTHGEKREKGGEEKERAGEFVSL